MRVRIFIEYNFTVCEEEMTEGRFLFAFCCKFWSSKCIPGKTLADEKNLPRFLQRHFVHFLQEVYSVEKQKLPAVVCATDSFCEKSREVGLLAPA